MYMYCMYMYMYMYVKCTCTEQCGSVMYCNGVLYVGWSGSEDADSRFKGVPTVTSKSSTIGTCASTLVWFIHV